MCFLPVKKHGCLKRIRYICCDIFISKFWVCPERVLLWSNIPHFSVRIGLSSDFLYLFFMAAEFPEIAYIFAKFHCFSYMAGQPYFFFIKIAFSCTHPGFIGFYAPYLVFIYCFYHQIIFFRKISFIIKC